MAATITLATATARLTSWIAADAAIALGQSYTIGDRTLTRVHAAEVRNNINYWTRQEAKLTRIAAGESGLSYSRAKFS